jgi:acetyl esterase/lipase
MKYESGWMDTTHYIPVPIIDHIRTKYLDIQYTGQDPLQKLDLYLPDINSKPFPLIIHIHGGGFTHCDKRDWHLYPMFYALREGFAVAAVNYRLAPASPFPAAICDIKSVAHWINENAKEYGLDAANVFLWGTSAGGNIASIVANTWYDTNFGSPLGYGLRAVAALCPVINMLQVMQSMQQSVQLVQKVRDDTGISIDGYFKPTPENFIKASADTYLTTKAPAYYLQHGTTDTMVPVDQSIVYAEKLKTTIGEKNVFLDLLQGADHAGPETTYMDEKTILPIFNFFKKFIHKD